MKTKDIMKVQVDEEYFTNCTNKKDDEER